MAAQKHDRLMRVVRVLVAVAAIAGLVAACGRETGQTPEGRAAESAPAAAAADVSCEPTEGTSRADVNEPFEISSSETGRLARLHVPGMTCEGCAWQIRETALAVPGVTRVHTILGDKVAVVDYDPAAADVAAIAAALDRAGYPATEILPET